ncbi:MAG: xanthine dehydrogenase family protein molybdopterin-binding subunit [Candidatus Palauibacterales bacterium]|nr:xanthine dehydrogenase family protein molybdopterin-binding subunit [Candidatus Palauibacterales bacterium]MDP2529691.1 xanthine dehydrogenase family protein molybdopterin-binding subunit [Candidatus Palauibacterales bacterium]MDP2584107.1 xanthine dehydrogenase family protein molybdopterin-binding subunit [Candidatus Palauibacterales bacterium]
MATTTVPKQIGARVRRKEDPRLITGASTYTDDLKLPGMAYCTVLRSPHAHARIASIDTSGAEATKGVLRVVTGRDVQEAIGGLPVAHKIEGLLEPPHRVLAIDEVRYVGDGVAAVVAEDPSTARDALERIEVEYEELEAVVDVEKAAAGGPFVHEELGTNVAFTFPFEAGDVDGAFQDAPVVLRQRIVNQRQIPFAVEPRAVAARFDRGHRKLEIWSSTQIPHLLRTQLSVMLGIPEHSVRVIAPEVGGGFGSKLNVYAEEALVGHLARELGRPVKWTATRTEGFQATIHGRDQLADVEIAASEDGVLHGMRVKLLQDLGAYHQLLTPVIPTLTVLMLPGAYRLRNLQVELKGVFTDKTPTDAYRGAGRPEANFIIERVLDLIADATGIDPIEVRRRNFFPADAFPADTCTGLTYDSGNYQAAVDLLLETVDYDALRREQAQRRERGELMGIGVACYVEICGLGPSAALPAGGWEACTLEVRRTGRVVVKTGVSPHGQGEETTFSQIVADALGVGLNDVEIAHGDTDYVPEGIGTFGSRAQAVGGAALSMALEDVRDKSRKIAGHLLEADPEDVVFDEGKLHIRGAPDRAVGFQDVVTAAYMADDLPEGVEPGLASTRFFEPSNFTFPFGVHLCVVDIDPDTGEPSIRRYVAVDDCGNVINPMIVDGQIHGGVAQAIAQSLYEQAVYDADGQLVTGSLMDYAVPRASYLPSYELRRTTTPTPVNPLGAKGVGEAGTIAGNPCVMNAVVDAVSHLGIRHVDMPATPEKLWRIITERD